MSTYITMLRGINVGGKTLKMEPLREAYQAMGFKNVRTFIQSGNVFFETGKGSETKLCEAIQKRIMRDFGLEVSVIARTPEQLAAVLKRNPFLKEKGIDLSRLHVTFLSGLPVRTDILKLDELKAGPDRFRLSGAEIYLHCPGGYGETKLSNGIIEKKLGLVATTRNWNTVNKLYEIAVKN